MRAPGTTGALRPHSMRAQILLLTMMTVALVLLALSVPLVVLLNRAAAESSLERATDTAQAVADYASTDGVDTPVLREYVDRVNLRDDAYPVRVDLADGTYLGATLPGIATRPRGTLGRDRGGEGSAPRGTGRLGTTSSAQVSDVTGGRLVTVHVDRDGAASGRNDVDVQVFVSTASVHGWVTGRLLVLAAAAAALLLIAAAAALWVSRRLVGGLDATAAAADALAGGHTDARAPECDPVEVRRVATALNRLASRIEHLITLERETVADLSHRLRTPLTAVRLDVEALPPSPQREELEGHVDLLERTLTAVIHAARRPEREGALPRCDAERVVRERVRFWGPLLEDQGRMVNLDVVVGASLPVRTAERDLADAVDALLENVVAHTPDGVPVRVTAREAADGVVVEVCDRGPGVPRGATGRGRSDRGSSGLGLDIARACAEGADGRLEIERVDGWTVARLVLARP